MLSAWVRHPLEINVSQAAGSVSDDVRETVQVLGSLEPARAMGLVVSHLMTKPAFARQPFGLWSRILAGQINRGHYRVAVQQARVRGFLGWALTDTQRAERWLAGGPGPTDAESRDGDILLINAWSADNAQVNRALLEALRACGRMQSKVYFKRYYGDGRVRPGRLDVNKFVASHLERLQRSGQQT